MEYLHIFTRLQWSNHPRPAPCRSNWTARPQGSSLLYRTVTGWIHQHRPEVWLRMAHQCGVEDANRTERSGHRDSKGAIGRYEPSVSRNRDGGRVSVHVIVDWQWCLAQYAISFRSSKALSLAKKLRRKRKNDQRPPRYSSGGSAFLVAC